MSWPGKRRIRRLKIASLGNGPQVTTHDKKRTSLLHAACENGHTEMASVLVERYKLGLEEEDRKGLTALARAALKNQVS